MANAVVEVSGLPTGLALTVTLYPLGSDVAAASGKALTERTNGKGIYRGTVTEALTGWHRILVLETTTVLAIFDVYMDDTATDHYAYDRDQKDLPAVRTRVELALPNAAADGVGGLPISDAGGLDLDAMGANLKDTDTSLLGKIYRFFTNKMRQVTDEGTGNTYLVIYKYNDTNEMIRCKTYRRDAINPTVLTGTGPANRDKNSV